MKNTGTGVASMTTGSAIALLVHMLKQALSRHSTIHQQSTVVKIG